MDIGALLPLIGVAVGWLLKEVSDHFRGRKSERADVGRALTGLLQLDSELRRLRSLLSAHKNRPISWDEYERVRVSTAERYLRRTDPKQTVAEAVDQLARFDPINAALLHDIAEGIAMAHRQSLQPIAKSTDGYVKALSVLEAGIEISERILKELTIKLARVHGFTTRVKLWWYWRRLSSARARKSHAFMEQQIHELYAQNWTPDTQDKQGGSSP